LGYVLVDFFSNSSGHPACLLRKNSVSDNWWFRLVLKTTFFRSNWHKILSFSAGENLSWWGGSVWPDFTTHRHSWKIICDIFNEGPVFDTF
jgi:hypothetical protein